MVIKSLQRSRRTVYGILVVCTAAIAMTGFGVNLYGGGSSESFAVRVYDQKVSFADLARERRNAEEFYRRMFKDNYEALMANLKIDLDQQVLERTIDDKLLLHFLRSNGFTYGENALIENVQTNVFGGGRFNRAGFESVARSQGMRSEELLSIFEGELTKESMISLFRAVSTSSLAETKAEVIRDNTSHSAWYVEFKPSDFESKVSAPSDEALEAFYTENATDYQLPSRVAYDYTILTPEKFKDSVELFPEDLQQYYIDNSDKYKLPARFKAFHIKLNVPAGTLPDKVEEIRKRGEEIHGKLTAGESFENLMTEVSDEKTSLPVDKDGYVQAGKLPSEVESAAISLKEGGITELIRTLNAFYILKVLEVKDSELKPFDEVKSEIEKELKEREAPAFASAKAQEILEKWTKSNDPFSAIVVANALDEPKSFTLNDASIDPDSTLKGLTEKVLDEGGNDKLVVEMGDRSILVSVTDYREEEIPAFSAIKDSVLRDWKKVEASRLAKENADAFLVRLKESQGKTLKEVATKEKLPVNEIKDVAPAKGGHPLLSNDEVRRSIFDASSPHLLPNRVIKAGDKYYLFQVHTIAPPKESDVTPKIVEAKKGSDQRNGEVTLRAFINGLKARAMAEDELKVS